MSQTIQCSSERQRASKRVDPLRRFVPTPYEISLSLMGRTVRVETNSQNILKLTQRYFASYPQASSKHPEFQWRIVGESSGSSNGLTAPEVRTSAFSDGDLSFVNLGQRSFVAVDVAARLGVAFLDEGFAEVAEPRFTNRHPLDILFCMSAASLGLTSLAAACVSLGEQGVLLLGEPNSGKTTAGYVAATRGLEFLADQAVFLENGASGIYAWGDPFPAVFRPATLEFFPELRSETRSSSYANVDFYYFDKSKFQSSQAHKVAPRCSILLQRATATAPRLIPMAEGELSRHLTASLLFKEGDRFQSQHAAVFDKLAMLPAYRLPYGEDPAIAAAFVQDLLASKA